MTRHRGAWLDCLAILGLMALVLSIFDDTFADRSYLVTGLAPVVVLLALALLTNRMQEGGWWYTLAALVVFSPLGSLAALRAPGPWGLPTLDTMSEMLADSFGAPVTLVSTVPPVDSSGEVMLVPFLIGFLATLPAAWLALGTTRPTAPAVPVALGMAATIPLGVLAPTLLVPRGIVVAILLLAWASVRARRRDAWTGARRGALAGTVTSVVTVALVACLVALIVPDNDGSERVLLRGRDDTPGIASLPVLPDPGPEDTRLFIAKGLPDGQRMRLAVLDRYDGRAWVAADESPGSEGYGTYKRIGHQVATLHDGPTAVVRVRLRPGYNSSWLPTYGELSRIDFAWNPGRTVVGDLRYNQATSTAVVVGGLDVRDRYEIESVVTPDSFTRKDATRPPTDDQEQPSGSFLDTSLVPFDRGELLPVERVLLLARYLRVNGAVSLAEDFDQTPLVLARRMLASRRIVATHFQYSALMALGASRLGVAARVVLGAEPGRGGLVDYGDVTSWVELQFADGTWRTLEPERYVGSRLTASDDAPAPGDFVAEELAEAAKGKDREIKPPEGSTDPDGTRAVDRRPAWQVVLLGVAGLAGVALLPLLLVPIAKVVRRRRRRRATTSTGVWVDGWQEVLDAARDRGTPVPEGWSRVAQATALGVGLELARRADAAVFAPGIPEDDADDFWEQCRALSLRLVASAPTRRTRWWSHLHPASLVAGWARRRNADRSARQLRHEDRRPRRQQPADA